jgi:hypothetical protein
MTGLTPFCAPSAEPVCPSSVPRRSVNDMLARTESAASETDLRSALSSCTGAGVAYRCLRLALKLGEVFQGALRVADLRRVAADVAARARETGDWDAEHRALVLLAEAERLSLRLPAMRATLEEIGLREPDHCGTGDYIHQVTADVDVILLRLDEAAGELDRAGRCGLPLSPTGLAAAVDLARLRPDRTAPARAAWLAKDPKSWVGQAMLFD